MTDIRFGDLVLPKIVLITGAEARSKEPKLSGRVSYFEQCRLQHCTVQYSYEYGGATTVPQGARCTTAPRVSTTISTHS